MGGVTLWVAFAIGGAFFQNLRSLLQRRQTQVLTRGGASYSRFLFALPLAWVYALWWPLPTAGFESLPFLAYCTVGAVVQILGTWCLVGAVAAGGFAVGTAYSKTEAAQTAAFGLLVLADPITAPLLLALLLSLVGVAIMYQDGAGAARAADSVQVPVSAGTRAGLGLGAAAGFALAAVCFRGAALTLAPQPTAHVMPLLAAAALTLAVTLSLQTLLQGIWLRLREPGQLSAVLRYWRSGLLVGGSGMAASLCWFSGVALYSAAAVRAVGQVEMLFALATGWLLFGERPSRRELIGIAFVTAAVLLLVITSP